MKIKRIQSLEVNCYKFKVKWDKTKGGASVDYTDTIITLGTYKLNDKEILALVCHELMEIVAIETNVRLRRPDCGSDYIFVYDHRQHDSMMTMFSGLLSKFIA